MALGEVFMLLYFAPCRPLARPHRRPRQNLPCLQYSGFVSFFILRTRWIPKQQGASACCPLRALHTAHPRLLVADVDEAVTCAFFFHPFCLLSFCPRPFQVQGAEFFTLFACCLFARALFRYKLLSDERKAVARLERCFERFSRPASSVRCQKSEMLDS